MVYIYFNFTYLKNSYTCDVADGRCNKGDVSLPFYKKIEATKTTVKVSVDVVCPGDQIYINFFVFYSKYEKRF